MSHKKILLFPALLAAVLAVIQFGFGSIGRTSANQTPEDDSFAFLPYLISEESEEEATATPTQTATPIPTQTASATPIATATQTATSVPGSTNTPTPVSTSTPTNTPAATSTNTPTLTATPTTGAGNIYLDNWIMNLTSETAAFVKDDEGSAELVNVQSVITETINGADYVSIMTRGIPNYSILITADKITDIEDHPLAPGVFRNGVGVTVTAGTTIQFHEDIGFNANNASCEVGDGGGFSPQSNACANQIDVEVRFPLEPEFDPGGDCETALGAIGYWVNGVSMYNWSDANSYENEGVWDNIAPFYRQHGIDMCLGHWSGAGEYHHHNYSACLGDQLGDGGSGHSPIYGFVADGYPIYGPWHADGELTESCWIQRDYSAASGTGCGADNERSCIFVDQYDITQGTIVLTDTIGPDTDDLISYPRGTNAAAGVGLYLQDYYYDSACTAQGDKYLDEHNGHEHDGLGYHYHATVTDNGDGTYSPAFPYNVGPTYYGDLPPHKGASAAGFANCYAGGAGRMPSGAMANHIIQVDHSGGELSFPLSLDALYGNSESDN